MTKTKETLTMLSQIKTNAKIVTLFFVILAFSGNFSEPAMALNNSMAYNNIYRIYDNSFIYNIDYINKKNKEKAKARVGRPTLLKKLSRGRKMSLDFKNNVLRVMDAVKYHESRGNYKSSSKYSTACGAYQYINSTWNNFQGYKTACDAPKSVQDQRMFNELYQRYLDKNGDWEKVIAAHFYPAWADNKSLWHKRPGSSYNPTIWEYVNKVLSKAGMK